LSGFNYCTAFSRLRLKSEISGWSLAAASFDHLITNQRVFTNDSAWESAKRGSWKAKSVTKHTLFFREKLLQTFRSQAHFMALKIVVVFKRQIVITLIASDEKT